MAIPPIRSDLADAFSYLTAPRMKDLMASLPEVSYDMERTGYKLEVEYRYDTDKYRFRERNGYGFAEWLNKKLSGNRARQPTYRWFIVEYEQGTARYRKPPAVVLRLFDQSLPERMVQGVAIPVVRFSSPDWRVFLAGVVRGLRKRNLEAIQEWLDNN